MQELINAIDETLSTRYKALEGDEDTLYVKDSETDIHYEIKVSECN